MQPLRTWLFAPGHEGRKVKKALESLTGPSERFASPDMVILDWEDAVPGARKDDARAVSLEALAGLSIKHRHRTAIRVNHPETEFFADDLAALAGEFLGAVLLPKAERTSEIESLVGLDLPIMVIIESALGVEKAFELCASHPQVKYAAFGPLDLLADLGGEWTPGSEETLYARQRLAIAARAAGLAAALDGPYPKLRDLEGLLEDTSRARRMGYDGRLLIHPAQVAVVADAFAPSDEELNFAERVLAAAALGEQEGRGAVSVDGRFIDPPVVRWAESVVAAKRS